MPDNLKPLNDAIDLVIKEKRKNDELSKNLSFFSNTLKPLLEGILSNSKISKEELMNAISQIKFPEVKMPEIPKFDIPKFPEIPAPIINYIPPKISVPKPEVTVNVPDIEIPDLKWPKGEMPITGRVRLADVDINNPLPVQIRDAKGNPVNLGGGGSAVVMGGGGGPAGIVTIRDIQTSSGASVIDQVDGAVKVVGSLSFNLDQSTDSIAQRQVSGAVDSVNVLQIAGNPAVVGAGWQDNALRVVQANDAVVSVNIVSGEVHLDVQQLSGAVDSSNISQVNGNPVVIGSGYQDNALRTVNATDAITSVNLNTINGNPVVVGGGYQDNSLRVVHATDAVISVNIVDENKTLEVIQVSGAINSVNFSQVNGNPAVVGSGYQDNSLRVVHATDAVVSVNIVGENQTLEVLQLSGAVNSVNVTQLGGVAIDTNAGDNSAGTMRIISAKSVNATTAAVSVGADAATIIAPTNLNRKSLAITHNAAFNLFVATGTATSLIGMPIIANQVIVFDDYTGPVSAIAQEQSATISVRYIEID